MSTDLSTLFDSKGILTALVSHHSHIAEVMTYNPRGTVQLLIDTDRQLGYKYIRAFFGNAPIDVPHEGTDNLKTWEQLEVEIRNKITQICQQTELKKHIEALKDAVEVLSHELWRLYFEKYPYWPKVGEENLGEIYIEKTHAYDYPVPKTNKIIWNCTGVATVHDTRPSQFCYRADIKGFPLIRLLIIDGQLLDLVEQKLQEKDSVGRRLAVDQMAKKMITLEVQKLDW